jgi:hypothetical protein
VTWLSLSPALAVVASLVVLTIGLQRVGAELAALRRALRRSQAAAVAIDDVERSAQQMADRATELHERASLRVRSGWTRQRSIDR